LSHNEYLEILYNLGSFGLLLAVYVYFYPVRRVAVPWPVRSQPMQVS
jgi:O-antigen ligase